MCLSQPDQGQAQTLRSTVYFGSAPPIPTLELKGEGLTLDSSLYGSAMFGSRGAVHLRQVAFVVEGAEVVEQLQGAHQGLRRGRVHEVEVHLRAIRKSRRSRDPANAHILRRRVSDHAAVHPAQKDIGHARGRSAAPPSVNPVPHRGEICKAIDHQVVDAELLQLQHDGAQVGAQDLRVRLLLQVLLEGRLRVQPEALARPRPPGAPGPLVRARLPRRNACSCSR